MFQILCQVNKYRVKQNNYLFFCHVGRMVKEMENDWYCEIYQKENEL